MVLSFVRSFGTVVAVVALLVPAIAKPPDHLKEDESEFLRQDNPVRKAKLLARLSDEEFQEIRQAADAGDYDIALKDLELFQKEIDVTKKGLDDMNVNPERKPAGFKELQISLRQGLRRLTDIVGSMTVDEQAPFQRVFRELDTVNRTLIRELFPRDSESLEAQQSKP